MKFRVKSSLQYFVSRSASILSSIACRETADQRVEKESVSSSREAHVSRIESEPSVCGFQYTEVQGDGAFTLSYEALVSSHPKERELLSIADCGLSSLPPEVLPFLFPSRYCESDQLRSEAGHRFGYLKGQLIQALAVEQWLRDTLQYDHGISHEGFSALDAMQNRAGVCRDFAHLGIAFCRALNIPARYATVYSCCLEPQDFHAVFEVYVGGQWFVLDGTGLAPLNGMVRIGTGRDASDTAVATLFGDIEGQGVAVEVSAMETGGRSFIGRSRDDLLADDRAISLP